MSKKDIDQQQFDYSNCQFEVRLIKKGFLGMQKVIYMYCTQDSFAICLEPYQQKPEKVVHIQKTWQIEWLIDPKKKNESFSNKTIGFKLITKAESDQKIEYFADSATNFLEEYDIVKKIGKGKYAKVYKVRRKDNNKYYAVKYLHKKKLETIEDSSSSLFNELKILRLINHPNCIKLIAVYEDDNGYYILMELCESNKTLQGELTRFKNPQFGYQVVRHILKQLLKGVEYIHSIGIMHRDLKPQNIMFASDNNTSLNDLKIIDFGLSQFYNDPNYIYVHVGTPGFVAPEILANESDDHRYTEKCDLFSVGVIFHILLTGKTVFPGHKFSEVLEDNKKCKIQFTGSQYEQLNKTAVDLLNKLLEPNPQKRLSAKQALKHPFLENETNDSPSYNKYSCSAANLDMFDTQSSSPTKIPNKLMAFKPFSNLQKNYSLKDLDQEIDLDDLKEKITTMMDMQEIVQKQEHTQKKMLYKLTQELVDVFLVLQTQDEYQDLDMFASPQKLKSPMKNSIINKGTLCNLQKVMEEDEGQNDNDAQQKEQTQEIVSVKLIQDQTTQVENKKKIISPLRISSYQMIKEQMGLTKTEEDDSQSPPKKPQYPKTIMKLMSFFPNEIFEDKSYINDEKSTVKNLGKFLIMGHEVSKLKIDNYKIQLQLQKIKKTQIFDAWFIQLIEQMISNDNEKVPSLKQLKEILDKNLMTQMN